MANKHSTRTKRRIHYADLNLGIDSNDDKSPPRKRKQSKAAALHEPSQTVIAARNQHVTQKSIQNSECEHTKLIGTVIITPPAKEIKGENDSTEIKSEQDWLKLQKNIPKESLSLNDPNVHPRLIHKDGTVCHSKSYWASINKKPPLKEFELPDLFSDNEESEIHETPDSMIHKPATELETPIKDTVETAVNTEKTNNKTLTETLVTYGEDNKPSKKVSTNNNNRPSVTTEKKNVQESIEPKCPSQVSSKTSPTTEHVVNTENDTTILETEAMDNKNNMQYQKEAPVNTENDDKLEPSTQNIINTETTDEEADITSHKQEAVHVNTENATPKTLNQSRIKEDRSNLMFSSDNSLFDEMTKQLD